MNQLYDKTIDIDNKIYRYDPDHDCYYRYDPVPSETNKERWIKVTVGCVFLIILLISGPPFLEWLK